MVASSSADSDVELTILMPCLNEAETLKTCIDKARRYLVRRGLSGEVLVADNGSTDGSQHIALAAGARVVTVEERGYGAALRCGIRNARGRFIVMGDADDSYDFSSLDLFVDALREGHELVMGNRFKGGIDHGAMPPLHRYVGNPVLSWLGRLFFRIPVGDFHCGLRGFSRAAVSELNLHTTGMEFASELVVAAALAGYSIIEVPTMLHKDGRSRPPHLRSFRDGWRHLRFLLLYSPRWLFLVPGAALFAIGLAATVALCIGPVVIGGVGFDIGSLLYAAVATILGYQAILFYVSNQQVAQQMGLLPVRRSNTRSSAMPSVELGIVIGLGLTAAGIVFAIVSFLRWKDVGYGQLDGEQTIRSIVPAVLGISMGVQTVLTSWTWSILMIGVNARAVAGSPSQSSAWPTMRPSAAPSDAILAGGGEG